MDKKGLIKIVNLIETRKGFFIIHKFVNRRGGSEKIHPILPQDSRPHDSMNHFVPLRDESEASGSALPPPQPPRPPGGPHKHRRC